jgi:hypothetical protein
MDRRRTAWLAAAPLLAGTAALMLGAAAASALAVVLTPYETPAPQVLDAGRAVLASTLRDLTDLRQLAPVAVGVLLAELTWVVGLGVAAQRLFPRRRRAVPAFAAVVLSALGAWVGIGLLAGADGLWAVGVQDAVNVVLVAGVLSALVVYMPAGQHWPMEAETVPHARAWARFARGERLPQPARPKAVTAPRPAGLR